MKKKTTPPHGPFQLQCYCHATRNYEPLLGCDYATEEEGLAIFHGMKTQGRDTGIRLVECGPGFRQERRVVASGPVPSCYYDDIHWYGVDEL